MQPLSDLDVIEAALTEVGWDDEDAVRLAALAALSRLRAALQQRDEALDDLARSYRRRADHRQRQADGGELDKNPIGLAQIGYYRVFADALDNLTARSFPDTGRQG